MNENFFMDALLLKSSSDVSKELGSLINLLPKSNARRIFSVNSCNPCFPVTANETGSLFQRFPTSSIHNIVMSKHVPLFYNNWGRAFLYNLNRSVVGGGTITLPYRKNKDLKKKGFWNLRELRNIFGMEISLPARGYATFKKTLEFDDVISTYKWFLENGQAWALTRVLLSAKTHEQNEEHCRFFLKDYMLHGFSWEKHSSQPWRENSGSTAHIGASEEVFTAWSDLTYYLGGVQYKHAGLANIVSTYFPKSSGLRYLDHGGGTGLLAAEMLFDSSLGIEKAVCCDCDLSWPSFAWATQNLTEFYMEQLKGRFFVFPGSYSDFPYNETYHIASYLGSLLYLPREEQKSVLSETWSALEPGGILVVHENIKRASFSRDYACMFTVEELDGLLGQFGIVDRYLSTATMSVTRKQAAQKTVFRVVQKRRG